MSSNADIFLKVKTTLLFGMLIKCFDKLKEFAYSSPFFINHYISFILKREI